MNAGDDERERHFRALSRGAVGHSQNGPGQTLDVRDWAAGGEFVVSLDKDMRSDDVHIPTSREVEVDRAARRHAKSLLGRQLEALGSRSLRASVDLAVPGALRAARKALERGARVKRRVRRPR